MNYIQQLNRANLIETHYQRLRRGRKFGWLREWLLRTLIAYQIDAKEEN